MPKGISGSGGVDSSALDGLINQLNNILDKQNEINATKVSPKADDKGLKPITKTLEEIRNEAKNTSRTNIELWNTKSLKKQIGEAKKILDDSLKSFDISKISSENISGFEKEFLNAFATIKTYSEKYGQEIASEYQNMFDAIFNKSDVFKQDDLQALFQKNINAALSNVKKGSFDVKYEADENWAKEQYKAYEQQAQIAKETANAVKQAEREKQEALMDTRDKILEETKTQLQQIKDMSADNKFLEIDDEQWARFQKSAGDMIQTLSEMGVEVRDLEDIFDSLSKKIYIPKDQFAGLKQGSITENVVGDVSEINKTQQKVEELYNEISRLQNELYNSPTNEAYKDLDKDYEEARIEITALKSEINDLNAELRYSVDFFTWDQKVEEVERLEKEIDELKNKLKSTGNGTGNGLSDEMTKGFNSEELSSFLNILEKIEEQLRNISTTLGTVDENSGFNNMISSIDVLLSKLNEMHKKIGTGIYNINVNQGSDETTFAQDESIKSYIRDTQNRYKSAYDKVVKKAGGEELLFTRINNILNTGIDQLNEAYSSINVSQIESKEQQVYRLMDFFKILRQAMSDENFGLDLRGVRLPSSNDENFRRSIRNKSGETERRKQQHAQESLLSDEPEETLPGLNQITQALERIEILITEISQKDLFGDSLLNVTEQLDKIVSKFDELASAVHTINDERGLISNQTPVSSNEKEIKKATIAIEEEGNAAKKSAEQKEKFVLANQKVAESGVETADGIKKATDAIKEEGKVVSENKIDTSQPSPKDDTIEYTNLLARREIQQGNLDAAKIRNDQTAIKYSQERISALNNEIEALEKLGNIDKEVAEQNLKNEIARINASEKVAKAEDAQAKQRTVNLNRQSKMIKDFSLWLSKNGVAAKAYSNEIEIIFNQLQQQGELTAEQLNKVQHEINNIMATAAREGKTGVTFIETLHQRFKSLAAYLASFASFYDVVRYVKEAFNTIRDLDTQLVDLRKTTTMSVSDLNKFYIESNDIAKQLGVTTSEIISQASAWSRLNIIGLLYGNV